MNSITKVPKELKPLLEEFVYQLLKNDPKDLYKFSADYFTDLYENKSGQKITKQNGEEPESAPVNLQKDTTQAKTEQIPENGVMNESKMNDILSDQDEEDDDVMDMPNIRNRYLARSARRESVAAESLDPEKIDYSQIKVYEKTDEQKARLNEAVKGIFIFRSLEQNQLPRLIDAMFEKNVEEEEVVIKQGDDGDNFYVIEKGVYDIIVNGERVGSYDDQGSFGELALMYNCPRAATIVAKSAGILWAMDRESFLKIVLHAAFKKRKTYEELLASASILDPLTEYERTNLADALVSRHYDDGEEIVREGDLGDEMFFVEQGEVIVLSNRGADGAEKQLRKIDKGGYFGELALLTDGHRNATIKAVKDVKLAVLDRSSFERLMGPCIDLMKGHSKDYLQDIIDSLGKDALSKYPTLVHLLDSGKSQLNDNESEAKPSE